MPRHPQRDPSPSSFGPLHDLDALPEDGLEAGPAPWADLDPQTGFAKQKDWSSIPLQQGCTPLVFGGGVFGQGMYNEDGFGSSDLPPRIIRLAFRYGINAIDTSPYYFPSEFIIGRALKTLSKEFPRSSYYLCTKAGRYGPQASEFDYSPQRIRSSVEASLRRLGTDYLDLVYLHDAEFVAAQVGNGQKDGMAASLSTRPRGDAESDQTRASIGLAPGDEPRIRGPGDEVLLAAVHELQALKEEGKIRNVGISGYPLPALLRLSRLVASRAPYKPLDAILSYSNHTLHSDILPAYQDLFRQLPTSYATPDGKSTTDVRPVDFAYNPPHIFNGSPFSMGLLTDAGPPSWHPAPKALKESCIEASRQLKGRGDGSSLAITALTYGIRGSEVASSSSAEMEKAIPEGPKLRTLLGMSTPDQVHSAIHAYRVLLAGANQAVLQQPPHTEGQGRTSSVICRPLYSLSTLSGQDVEKLVEEYNDQVEKESIVKKCIEQAGMLGWSWASPGDDTYD